MGSLLMNHERELAEEEGWHRDHDLNITTAMTIVDDVVAEIGEEAFRDAYVEADLALGGHHSEAALAVALERSGYNAALNRLVPPGTEITELGENTQERKWRKLQQDAEGWQRQSSDVDWDLVAFESHEYLLVRSGLWYEDRARTTKFIEWYRHNWTREMTTRALEFLYGGGQQPAREAAREYVDALIADISESASDGSRRRSAVIDAGDPINVVVNGQVETWKLHYDYSKVATEYVMVITAPNGRLWWTQAGDVFGCLHELRKKLEKKGIRICCNGARTNAWASGMQRDMGGGQSVYLLELERQPTLDDDVQTLGPAPCEEIAESVKTQEDFFHEQWLPSIEHLRRHGPTDDERQ